MLQHIQAFFSAVAAGKIEIYNEFSLQHELGLFLRSCRTAEKIQFERNVSFFSFARDRFIKKEIDISLFATAERPISAIELKFPRRGQHPEQMFKACQDIFFLEQLVAAGFREGYFIMVADDPLFYRGDFLAGIYAFFRGDTPISGQIFGPTGDTTRQINIGQRYNVQWQDAVSYTHLTLPTKRIV